MILLALEPNNLETLEFTVGPQFELFRRTIELVDKVAHLSPKELVHMYKAGHIVRSVIRFRLTCSRSPSTTESAGKDPNAKTVHEYFIKVIEACSRVISSLTPLSSAFTGRYVILNRCPGSVVGFR